jgi:hypothetical protein
MFGQHREDILPDIYIYIYNIYIYDMIFIIQGINIYNK